MYAPGSPSSALQTRYFSGPAAFARNSHLFPVRKPGAAAAAQLGGLDLLDDAGRVLVDQDLVQGLVPADRDVFLDVVGVDQPQLRRTILTCPSKNGTSFQFGTSG
jgi:threonine dehydrogenase-like Zn-dependent dehydrogenase